jgi:hypothetical protein
MNFSVEGCTSHFHGSCFAQAASFHNACHVLKAAATTEEQTAAFAKGMCCVHTSDRNRELEGFVPAAGPVAYVHAEFLNEVGERIPSGSAGAPATIGAGTKPLVVAPLRDGRQCILPGATSPKVTLGEVSVVTHLHGGGCFGDRGGRGSPTFKLSFAPHQELSLPHP